MTDKRHLWGRLGIFFAARECCNSGQFSPKYWWYLRVNPTMFKLIHLLQCTVSGNFMCATSLKYRFQQQQKQTDRRTEFPLIKRKILPQISQMHVHCTMYIYVAVAPRLQCQSTYGCTHAGCSVEKMLLTARFYPACKKPIIMLGWLVGREAILTNTKHRPGCLFNPPSFLTQTVPVKT